MPMQAAGQAAVNAVDTAVNAVDITTRARSFTNEELKQLMDEDAELWTI